MELVREEVCRGGANMSPSRDAPPLRSAGQILREEMREAIAEFQNCVTPIFSVNEKREAKLLGSGILIEVGGNTFLCTAKHVIDENAISTLYIDGPCNLKILAGDFFRSGDDHDIAVLKLNPEQTALLKKYSPLIADHIGNQDQTSACKYVEFIGFPGTKNPRVYQRNEIKKLLHSNGCTVIEITSAKIRLNFNRNKNVDAKTRQRVTAPEPQGMSGGAMFGVPINSATIEGKPQPKLIGISTDAPSPNEVFGTNIAIVLSVIRDGWHVTLPSLLNPSHLDASVRATGRK
jgi:hypothetical protein